MVQGKSVPDWCTLIRNKNKQAIGLFGGTFDPVHDGHISLARHVLSHCSLEKILFIPAPCPPHKKQPTASFSHRVAMLEAALADCPDLMISLIENERSGPSYTIETINDIIERYGKQQYSLIIGADSLVDLVHWYQFEKLLRLINLIVIKRIGFNDSEIAKAIVALDPAYTYDTILGKWIGVAGTTIEYLVDIQVPISSSRIRSDLAGNRPIRMVPESVLHYIHENKLYLS